MGNRTLIASLLLGGLIITSGSAMAQSCSSFNSCKEAVASYKNGNSKLDRDKDGIPCESLCGKNGEYMK
jgi:hypothetical protein